MSKVIQKQMQRRSAIIEKLIPKLNNIPFDQLSVADICEAAEISIGSFYHYFKTKSDLLIGLMGLIDNYMADDIFPKLNNENELENIKSFAIGWAQYVYEHGLERSKLISGIKPFDVDYMGNKRLTVLKLEEIITSGQKKGQITKLYEPGALSEYIMFSIRGVSTDWSRHDGSYSVTEKMKDYISFVMRALEA